MAVGGVKKLYVLYEHSDFVVGSILRIPHEILKRGLTVEGHRLFSITLPTLGRKEAVAAWE